MTPRISIITPSFNSGKYIEDAILSILGQQYENYEHIVVDGGSTDNTIEILKRYKHVKWISEPDNGQSEALNKGFKMATGEIIGWLNADEFYMPDAFSDISAMFETNESIDVLYGDVIFVDAQGTLLRYRCSHGFSFATLLYYGPFLSNCSLFFRRSVLERGCTLRTDFRYVMDHEFFVHLATIGLRFRYSPKPYGVFRWTGANISLSYDDPRRTSESVEIRKEYGIKWSRTLLGTRILYQLLRMYRFLLFRILFFGLLREFWKSTALKQKNIIWF